MTLEGDVVGVEVVAQGMGHRIGRRAYQRSAVPCRATGDALEMLDDLVRPNAGAQGQGHQPRHGLQVRRVTPSSFAQVGEHFEGLSIFVKSDVDVHIAVTGSYAIRDARHRGRALSRDQDFLDHRGVIFVRGL